MCYEVNADRVPTRLRWFAPSKAVCGNEYNEGIFAKLSGGNSSANCIYSSKSVKISRTGVCACSPKKKK